MLDNCFTLWPFWGKSNTYSRPTHAWGSKILLPLGILGAKGIFIHCRQFCFGGILIHVRHTLGAWQLFGFVAFFKQRSYFFTISLYVFTCDTHLMLDNCFALWPFLSKSHTYSRPTHTWGSIFFCFLAFWGLKVYFFTADSFALELYLFTPDTHLVLDNCFALLPIWGKSHTYSRLTHA